MKKNILLLFSLLVFISLIFEFLLNIFYPQNLDGWYAYSDESGLNILKENTVYNHRINNRNIKYSFGSLNNRITKKQIINQDKILILGDSFTFGWLVNDENIFVNHLQNHFKKFNFINPSVPGWGASDYVRFAENYCNQIKPKKIIVMLNTDDFTRAWLSKLYKFEIYDTQNAKNNIIDIGYGNQLNYDSKFHKIPFYKFFIKNSHLIVFIRQLIVDIKNGNINYFKNLKKDELKNSEDVSNIVYIPNQKLEDFYVEASMLGKILFLRLKEISRACESKLIVIYSGWWDYADNHHNNPTLYFLNEAQSFFAESGIEYYDFVKNMKDVHNNFNKYLILNDWHPNEEGHRIIAKNIIEKIVLK